MFPARYFSIAVLVFSVACASGSNAEPDAAPSIPTRSADVITAAELTDPTLGSANLYEAIRRLRPRFLSQRGQSSIRDPSAGAVQVSVDGGPLSAVSVLTNYLPSSISEVRFLNSADATQRFGTTANGGGVILVRSR